MLSSAGAYLGPAGEAAPVTVFWSSVTRGIPALTGVFWGVSVSGRSMLLQASPLATLGLAMCAVTATRWFIGPRNMHLTRWLLELCAVAATAAVATSTQVILWVATRVATSTPPQTGGTTDSVIPGILVGAVTTYFATLWTDEIQKGEGVFSAGWHFREALRDYFGRAQHSVHAAESVYPWIWKERVDQSTNGWGFSARGARATKIAAYVRARGHAAVAAPPALAPPGAAPAELPPVPAAPMELRPVDERPVRSEEHAGG